MNTQLCKANEACRLQKRKSQEYKLQSRNIKSENMLLEKVRRLTGWKEYLGKLYSGCKLKNILEQQMNIEEKELGHPGGETCTSVLLENQSVQQNIYYVSFLPNNVTCDLFECLI